MGRITAMGKNVIYVSEHKTSGSFGSADLIVEEEVFTYLERYRDELRPGGDCSRLFLTWNATRMDPSGVINALSSELIKAGSEKK